MPAAPRAVAVFVHGYGDWGARYREFLAWLAARGYASYVADLRGHGASDGLTGYVRRWEEYRLDLACIRAEVAARHPGLPLVLLGQSHGGLLVAREAIEDANGLLGIVLVSPFLQLALSVSPLIRGIARVADRIAPWLPFPNLVRSEMLSRDREVVLAHARHRPRRRVATPRWFFTMQRAQAETLARAGELATPLLVVIGGRDPIARSEATRAFFAAVAAADKTLLESPEMRHEPLWELDREAIWRAITDWIAARLPDHSPGGSPP